MKLRAWFNRFHNRPLKIAAGFLLAVWFVFAYWSWDVTRQKQELAATQTADLLSLAISSKDRPMAESILEALVAQSGASSAAICEGRKQVLSANSDFSGCENNQLRFRTVIEREISGSGRLRLNVIFDWRESFASSLTLLIFGLVLVVAGFYFIQIAQRQIEKGILSPLLNKLLTDEILEIEELEDLRRKVREAQKIEAQKAAALAIEENNQQVAHDIRGPIAAINELLKLAPIGDAKILSALGKAVGRINSVASDLLSQHTNRPSVAVPSSYDIVSVVRDIAAEKRLLFLGGTIETVLTLPLVVETKLPEPLFARILSNIIDNAMAACVKKKNIRIATKKAAGCVEISVSDTGVGIGEESLKRIGEKGFSLRKLSGTSGTGRGVFSAKQTLAEIGGDIAFRSVVDEGTTVTITVPARFPENAKSRVDLILIDNEDYVRLTWEAKASNHGIGIATFSSVSEFVASSSQFCRDTPIFIDSHLGDGPRGESIAPELKALGFRRIYLATNYQDMKEQAIAGVDSVIGKDFGKACALLYGNHRYNRLQAFAPGI